MVFASTDLRKEHEGILLGLDILEQMIKTTDGRLKADFEEINDMLGFLKLFADKCHHGKEENLLFPVMEEAGIPNRNGPIGELLLEHEEGRRYISQMTDAVSGTFNEQAFASAAAEYILLLRSHIQKENNDLFNLSDEKIPQEKQTELLEAFEKFEEEVMGEGTHEKLHELLHKFKHKYLNQIH